MNPKDFFKELGLGDDDLQQAREWVSYKKFASSVPDVLKLDEYVNTVYKHAVDKDAKPHQWFSERYMKEKYLGHIKKEWLEGLSFDTAHHWTPGDAIVFDAVRLHCASDFRKTCSKKLGLSIFTNYRK